MKFRYLIRRAEAVIEALPYLRKFHDKIVVVKYGGSAMDDPLLRASVIQDIVLLKLVGMHPVVVHGGGPEISRALKRKKIQSRFIQGLRVTTKEIIRVIEKVLDKKINQNIVSLIKKSGGRAKGFYGKKGKVIRAQKLWLKNEHDLGFVGRVVGIRYRFLSKWMKKGYIPVLSSIGVGKKGKTYNINADQAAAAIAAYLSAVKLIFLTDVKGVLDKAGRLVSQVNAFRAGKMIKSRQISGGMIPKVKSGLYAIKEGVEKVHIVDGRIPHAILLEIFTDHGIGTIVVK